MHFDIASRIHVISGTNSRGSEWYSVFTCICVALFVSTLDASDATCQNTVELIIISDAVYTGCGAAWQNTVELIIISDAVYTGCGAARQNTVELIIISDAVYTGCGAARQNTVELIIISDAVYTGCGAARQNTVELIIIRDAVYTRYGAARQIPDSKLLPRSIHDVLTQSSNDMQRLFLSCPVYRQTFTLDVAAWHDSYRVRCRQGVCVWAKKTISINITISILNIAHPAMWLSRMRTSWYRCWNDISCSPNIYTHTRTHTHIHTHTHTLLFKGLGSINLMH